MSTLTSAEITDVEGDLTEAALATGLLDVDASRRVGWAKAFDALRRVDSLEEELRQIRDEQKYLRRAYSRLIGFITHARFSRSPILDEEFAAHAAAEETFRSEDAWNQGTWRAQLHRAHIEDWDDKHLRWRERNRRQAHQWTRRLHSELRTAGSQAGHFTRIRRRRDADSDSFSTAIVCSCGDRFPYGEEKLAYRWRCNHLAEAAFQTSYLEFRRRFSEQNPKQRWCYECGGDIGPEQGERHGHLWFHFTCLPAEQVRA